MKQNLRTYSYIALNSSLIIWSSESFLGYGWSRTTASPAEGEVAQYNIRATGHVAKLRRDLSI